MNKKEKEIQRISKELAPNKYVQPFSYQQWKIVNKKIGEREEKTILKRQINPVSEFIYRFSKSFSGMFGVILLVMLIVMAFIMPYLVGDPSITNHKESFLQIMEKGKILGTNGLGMDVWARLWHGLNFSFRLAFMATLIDVVIGATIGIMMGHLKKFDVVMQWVIKVLSNIPVIILMILATLVFKPSFWILVGSMSITGWIGMSNQMRAQVKRASTFEWVTASKILGTPTRKIIWNYIPVIIPLLITQLVFTIPGAILGETALAVIGLSIPGDATLGNMISDGSQIITLYPRYTIIPAFFLVLITTSIQFIGNAIQSALKRQR